jgi:hypothetical protein
MAYSVYDFHKLRFLELLATKYPSPETRGNPPFSDLARFGLWRVCGEDQLFLSTARKRSIQSVATPEQNGWTSPQQKQF